MLSVSSLYCLDDDDDDGGVVDDVVELAASTIQTHNSIIIMTKPMSNADSFDTHILSMLEQFFAIPRSSRFRISR